MPSPRDILRIEQDRVPEFIRDQANARTLSALMQHLNEQLLAADAATSQLAARALAHLGFPEYA